MTRYSYLAAPVLLFTYGVARLVDGIDGTYGPGAAWTFGHVCFFVALVLFGVVLVAARRVLAGGRAVSALAVGLGLLGIVVFARSVVVDLIVGWRSTDRAAMNARYPHYDRFPLGVPKVLVTALDQVAPMFLVLGLLTLTVLLAVQRTLRWWAPALVLLGFVAITVDTDLLPVGSALLGAGLYPMTRRPGTP
jgi:hypothetical protein